MPQSSCASASECIQLHALAILGPGAFALGVVAQLNLFNAGSTTTLQAWLGLTVTAASISWMLMFLSYSMHKKAAQRLHHYNNKRLLNSVLPRHGGGSHREYVSSKEGEKDKLVDSSDSDGHSPEVLQWQSTASWQTTMFTLMAGFVYTMAMVEAIWLYKYTDPDYRTLVDATFTPTNTGTFVMQHKWLMLQWLLAGAGVGGVAVLAHLLAWCAAPTSSNKA